MEFALATLVYQQEEQRRAFERLKLGRAANSSPLSHTGRSERDSPIGNQKFTLDFGPSKFQSQFQSQADTRSETQNSEHCHAQTQPTPVCDTSRYQEHSQFQPGTQTQEAIAWQEEVTNCPTCEDLGGVSRSSVFLCYSLIMPSSS